jgi:hypothetical protein
MTESRRRILIILAISAAVEAALFITVKLGPALVYLVRPVYVVVAMIGIVTAWMAARRRRGHDRRKHDRRT